MSETEIQSVDTGGASAESGAVAAPEPVVETFDQTFDRVASEVIAKAPVRGPDGKFQPKVAAPSAPEGAEVPGSPQAAPPAPVPPVIEAPQSLPAEVKEKWSTLPPDVQKFWADREGEIHRKFTADGERLKALTPLEEALKPFEGRLKQINAPAAEYVRALATADLKLSTDFGSAIREIFQMYGQDPAVVFGTPGAQAPAPTHALHQKLSRLEADNQTLKQRLDEFARASEQSRIAAAEQRIAELAKDRPYLKDVEDLMATFLEGKHAKTPEEAYDMAIKAHPEVSAKIAKAAEEAARKKAEAEAREKAAKDERIAPFAKRAGSTPTTPLKGSTWEDTLDRVAAKVRG